MLPILAGILDDGLEHAETFRVDLRQALPKPYVLGNATLDCVFASLQKGEECLPIYKELLAQWARDPQGHDDELARLRGVHARMRIAFVDSRHVAEELRRGTLENVLAAIATIVGAFSPNSDLS